MCLPKKTTIFYFSKYPPPIIPTPQLLYVEPYPTPPPPPPIILILPVYSVL